MNSLSLSLSLVLTTLFFSRGGATSQDLIRSSCVQATYPTLCLRTLSSYSPALHTPRDLAQATITFSLSLARTASRYLAHDPALRQGGRRQRVALDDCIEQMADSVDELSNSLGVLQELGSGDRRAFRWQMSNAETWVSTALTNEETCLDGFVEVEGAVKLELKRKVTKLARATSNALYMINRLDGSSGRKALAP